MIIAGNTQTIQRSEDFEESAFTIQATGKAFRILSDGLYSDKIHAIIRELSCNAFDAHIAANNKEPFQIHLPNKLEPYFSIRDFGTGISHENIKNVFTVYFKSTKTETNDMIGCLGLGCKSPFSYTDSFNVTSYYNGKKNLYSVFVNEEEVPSCVLMNSVDTLEANGLEISFAVKDENFREFIEKTPKVFRYFKMKPAIKGAEVTHIKHEYFLQKGNWSIRKHEDIGYGSYISGAKAVMGNIAYDISDFPDTLPPIIASILRWDIDIFFKIGDLDVAASRESLSYKPDTKKLIIETLEKISKEILVEIQNKLNDCKSLWEARLLIYSMKRGEYKMFDNLINVSGKALTWQGQELAQMGEFDRIRITDTLKIHINIQQYAAINYRKAKLYGINYMYVSNKVKFYKKDIKKNIHNRLKKIYDECKNNGISTAIFLLDEKQAGGIDEFKKYIGMSKDFVIENLSTLPYDVEETDTKSVYNPKNAVKILRYDGRNGYSQTNSSWWIKETVNTDDTTQTFYYIAIDRYIPTAITSYSNETTASYINKYINVLDQIKTTIPAIYGVKISELEKIEKKSNWIKFEDYVKSCFENYMKIQNIEQIHGDNNMFNISNYYTEEGQSNRKFLSLIQCFENTIDINIQKWMKRYEDTQKYHDILNHIQNYTRLFNNVGLTVKSIDSSKEYNEFLNDFFNRYKLLKYIKNDDSTKCIAEIKKYVNMLDNVACIW